jgi:hypothetical protein
MSDASQFREVASETFRKAWERAIRAVRERPPSPKPSPNCGWREDASGLRWDVHTDEWDDSWLVHVTPRQPCAIDELVSDVTLRSIVESHRPMPVSYNLSELC